MSAQPEKPSAGMLAPQTPILPSPDPPSPEPSTLLVETDRLVLRRWTPSDAEELQSIANYAEVAKNLSHRFPFPYTLQVAHASLERWASIAASTCPNYPIAMAVCLKPEGSEGGEPRLIGSMGLSPGEGIEYRTWTLGYFLTPPSWGKGYATEAVSALVRWAFATWPTLNRVEASFYHWNAASEGVLRKSGFTREGVRRGATEKHGVVNDDVLYGIVRSDLAVEGDSN